MTTQTIVAGCTASGKPVEIQGNTLTPHCDAVIINPAAPRLSIEYAKARTAINEDFKFLFAKNQALAKRTRKESKQRVVQFLKGTVSKNKEQKLIVTFPDGSVANL